MAEKKKERLREEFGLETESPDGGSPAKKSNPVIACVILCTMVIVFSQFASVEFAQRQFRQSLEEIEYGKVGGEANFRLLQEIQKDRTSTYLKDLEEKEPEYIRGIKRKLDNGNGENLVKTSGKLTAEEVESFRSTLATGTGTQSKTTVVEFSDFACPFCKEYHAAWTVSDFAREAGADYALKILPNKKHEGSDFLARAAKCVGQKSWTGAFSEFSDTVFSASWSANESAYAAAGKFGLSKVELETCAQSAPISELVEKDMGQGMYLKIRATPSVLVLDNASGKYVLIKGEPDAQALESAISESSTTDE